MDISDLRQSSNATHPIEPVDDLREMLVMRPDDHRTAVAGGFDRVVATAADQAAPDHRDVSPSENSREGTNLIKDEHLPPAVGRRAIRPACGGPAGARHRVVDRSGSSGVARGVSPAREGAAGSGAVQTWKRSPGTRR